MKIFFLPTLNAPVVYHRMEKFVIQMRKLGHTVIFSYHTHSYNNTCLWERNINSEFMTAFDDCAKNADIVVMQTIHSQKAVALLCAAQELYRKPILAEFDDDIYTVASTTSSHKDVGPNSHCELWGDEQIRRSDGVIVSTDYLKKRYGVKNPKVSVIPNCIDFDLYDNLNDNPNDNQNMIKIGWHGGAGHSTNLRLLKDVVPVILKKYPNVIFHFKYGGYPIDYLQGDRIIFEDYNAWVPCDQHPQWLKDAHFDIGLAPLRDSHFNRAKSNLRWLQHSALKIPTVGSNVEPLKCIKEGKTGLLAKEPEEWIEKISQLVECEEARKHIGKAAYKEVKKKFNVERITKRYLEVLNEHID